MVNTAAGSSNNTSSTGEQNNDYINISEKDRVSIELLKALIKANALGFVSDSLSMQAAINGIKSICNKYTHSEESIYNPDQLVIYAISVGLLSRVIITTVGYRKYQMAYEAWNKGDTSVNLDNFIKINFVNAVFIFGGLIALGVAKNVYDSNRLNIFV